MLWKVAFTCVLEQGTLPFGLGDKPLYHKVFHVNIQNINLRINDLFRDGSWNLQALATVIPETVHQYINQWHPIINQRAHDMMIWSPNVNGSYTSKSAYSWLLHQRLDDDLTIGWAWIWRMKSLENKKFLLQPITPICPCCNLQEEDFLHCFRDCILPKWFWRRLGFEKLDFFHHTCHVQWLQTYTKGENHSWFIVGLWCVWHARNDICFNHKRRSL